MDVIEEIIACMDEIHAAGQSLGKPSGDPRALQYGLRISKNASQHPDEVPMTPFMKSGLIKAGDLKPGERLKTGAPQTKFEKWLVEVMRLFLLKYSGKELTEYDYNKPVLDPEHYWVDCWLNMPKNGLARDIAPGQLEEVNETITEHYVRPTKHIGLREMLRNDPEFAMAVRLVLSEMPVVVASTKIREVNIPFMTKHTNVGYPWFANDKTQVPNSQDTYATMTMRIAEENRNNLPKIVKMYRFYTEFTRWQNQKGRLIIASPRVLNLILNQLESEEIATYKAKCPLFVGYNDDKVLENALDDIANFCIENDLDAGNFDYHRYDRHILEEWKELVGAMSMIRCGGGPKSRSGKIAMWRAASGLQASLVAGTLNKVVGIYGRIFSGELDTNRGGGLINAVHMTYQMIHQDKSYLRDIVNKCKFRLLVMGDDVLVVFKRGFNIDAMRKNAKQRFDLEIDDATKNAAGIKFLQYRKFEYQGVRHFVYPMPRVILSALKKERPSTLGECGWELSVHQQLFKLLDFPPVFEFAVNLIAYLDDYHLMTDKSMGDILAGAQKEDRERVQMFGKRAVSTAERLYDGDPTKARQHSKDGELDPNFFDEIHARIRDVYDPNYLANNGYPLLK